MSRSIASPPRALVAAVVTTGLLAAPLVATLPPSAEGTGVDRAAARRGPTVIQVDAARTGAKVAARLLGVNHRYPRNGFGLWEPAADTDGAPDPTIIRFMRRTAIGPLRFPGGTTATMYDWKRAIGAPDERPCQIEGHGNQHEGFGAVRTGLDYGPDEYMEVVDASGATPLIMMPFVNNSPRDAADWVEYMNSPLRGNPGGGVDWASRRAANGHRAPYDIGTWEVGNESHVAPRRYRFSGEPKVAVRQYADGGRRIVEAEPMGRRCAHPARGVSSNGRPDQVFEATYSPATLGRNGRLTVGSPDRRGREWRRVSKRDLRTARPRARVYSWDRRNATATFGSGTNGRVPPQGAIVRVDYRNPYPGFFAYARAMKRIDPRVRVCASWGSPLFAKAARARDFDCLSAHPLTNFGRTRPWKDQREGHDRMMFGVAKESREVRTTRASLPPRTPLLLTEFQPIKGWDRAYPNWSSSMSNAVYMGSLWTTWLRQGIQWANGGDLLGYGPGAVFGSPTQHAYSVEAVVREAIKPMFRAGGRVVAARIADNPVRRPRLQLADPYPALSVAATRVGKRQLWLFVVNRTPGTDVKATVRFDGFRAARRASVRRVVGNHFTESNPPGRPRQVVLGTGSRRVGKHRFTMRFPAHSVVVVRIPGR